MRNIKKTYFRGETRVGKFPFFSANLDRFCRDSFRGGLAGLCLPSDGPLLAFGLFPSPFALLPMGLSWPWPSFPSPFGGLCWPLQNESRPFFAGRPHFRAFQRPVNRPFLFRKEQRKRAGILATKEHKRHKKEKEFFLGLGGCRGGRIRLVTR